MSKYKILFKITGSIAAYKAAYLISKLVQNDFEVQTVVSNSALHFIGKATLEGLTGKKVFSDSFEDGNMMSHINLVKWADLVILCPASANTINKLANGIADNLITSLFLAHDWNKPYLIAPAMNTNMFYHPITKKSLRQLESIGVKVLPADTGYLACGDIGEGKLLDTDVIYNYIISELNTLQGKKRNVLITAGATREFIDGVRFISNISTGKTSARLAEVFSNHSYSVTYLHSVASELPECNCTKITFEGFESLKTKLFELLEKNDFDLVIHAAAVSDYTVDKILIENDYQQPSKTSKLNSDSDSLTLKLKPTEKLIKYIKDKSKNQNMILTAFKFVDHINLDNPFVHLNKIFHSSNADFVVLNALADRTNFFSQRNFYLFNKERFISMNETPEELAISLIKNLNYNWRENVTLP